MAVPMAPLGHRKTHFQARGTDSLADSANDDRADADNLHVVQRDRLGGLVREYERAA